MNDDYRDYVTAAASLFGVAIDPAWEPTVLASFATLISAGQLVMDFPLGDEAEPGPVFCP